MTDRSFDVTAGGIPAAQVLTRRRLIADALRRFAGIVLVVVAVEVVVSFFASLLGLKFVGVLVLLLMVSGLGLVIFGGFTYDPWFGGGIAGRMGKQGHRGSGTFEATSTILILLGLALLGVTAALVLLVPRAWLY
jgi:hypothetical protein